MRVLPRSSSPPAVAQRARRQHSGAKVVPVDVPAWQWIHCHRIADPLPSSSSHCGWRARECASSRAPLLPSRSRDRSACSPATQRCWVRTRRCLDGPEPAGQPRTNQQVTLAAFNAKIYCKMLLVQASNFGCIAMHRARNESFDDVPTWCMVVLYECGLVRPGRAISDQEKKAVNLGWRGCWRRAQGAACAKGPLRAARARAA